MSSGPETSPEFSFTDVKPVVLTLPPFGFFCGLNEPCDSSTASPSAPFVFFHFALPISSMPSPLVSSRPAVAFHFFSSEPPFVSFAAPEPFPCCCLSPFIALRSFWLKRHQRPWAAARPFSPRSQAS